MEKVRGFIFIVCLEAAIISAGYIVAMLYPNASVWVWSIVFVLALFGVWVCWPKDANSSNDDIMFDDGERRPSTGWQEFLPGVFPRDAIIGGIVLVFCSGFCNFVGAKNLPGKA